MGGLSSDTFAGVEHERLAAIILDGMYQFVALLNTKGDILAVNRAALEGAGHRIEEIRGKPFWTARWWQVSEEIQDQLKAAIRRAANGEFVRYEVQAYGDNAGLNQITTDFSLQPIRGESGEVEYLLPEGRNITERKQAENEVARQAEELRILNERLKELDRIKTQFFANVSHEFRTPLTLMLGPLENAIAAIDAEKQPDVAANLATSHRNSLRLLKLVNTLLDFSRIEAGRIQASFEPTDLATLTVQLTSVFRSAMERAGLQLIIHCQPLSDLVYVDREMWEKIVLNLLSNALKFTFEGEVSVELREFDGAAELLVRDTGTGIPADEIPRLFERFHRVKGARGRSYEGSGIGLALVQELVKLHGGDIAVESEMDKGTTFRIRLPFGKLHLPAEQIGGPRELSSTAIRSEAFVQEALRWQTGERLQRASELLDSALFSATAKNAGSNDAIEPERRKVLVVDDNADMRDYMQSLLAHQHVVMTAANGEEGLKIAQAEQPNLILTDIMMPGMDGFALLRALRSEVATREIPVIFLSARAGEEATIEGREAGADDYLVKPFSARELLARVGAHLKLVQARKDADRRLRENEARFRALVTATSDVIYQMSPDWKEMAPLQGKGFVADASDPSGTWLEKYIHPDDRTDVMKNIREAIQAKDVFELEHRVFRVDGTLGWTLSRAVPMMDDQGNIIEWFGAASDVTVEKQAQESLGQSLAKLSEQARLLDLSNDAIVVRDQDDRVTYWNRGATEIYGYTREEAMGRVTHELLRTEFPEPLKRIEEKLTGDGRWSGELIHTRKDGAKIFVGSRWALERDVTGRKTRILETNNDITQRKQAEEALRRSEKLAAVGRLAATVSHEINNPLESVTNLLYLAQKDSGMSAAARDNLVLADQEIERIAVVARQTLGFYRDSTVPALINVSQSINEVLAVYGYRLRNRGIDLQKDLDAAAVIFSSAAEFKQVFSNLILNAIDAVPSAGGRIWVKARVSGDWGSSRTPGVRIIVADNGSGIAPEHMSRIFESFYTTKVEIGTGLGLWLSRNIIQKYQGRIRVRSSVYLGNAKTAFFVYWPSAKQEHSLGVSKES